jgi:hypothetical protein
VGAIQGERPRTLTDADITAALREVFRLPLTGEEVAQVLASLPPPGPGSGSAPGGGAAR